MPSKLRSETARRNGAKSRGPVTEAGKRASSLNAIKHGIHSSQIVLSMEDPEQYDRLLAAYLDKFQPVGPVEEALVMDIVNARWRLQRIQHLETAVVDLQVHAILEDPSLPDDVGSDYVCGRAYQLLFDKSRAVSHLHRQEARLNRIFHRSHALLQQLQAERQAAEETKAVEPRKKEKSQNEPKDVETPNHEADSSSSEPSEQRPETDSGLSSPTPRPSSEPLKAEPYPPVSAEPLSLQLNGRNTSFKQPDPTPRILLK